MILDSLKIRKILNIAIIVLIVGIIFMIGVFVLRSIFPPTWQQSKPIGYNIYAPEVIDNSTINYYTGNTFASLNTKTGERKPLTTHYILPGLQDIHWLKNGVVFLSPQIDDYSDIAAYARATQEDNEGILYDFNTPTYWYLSFADNSFTLLNKTAYSSPDLTTLTTSDGGVLYKVDDTRFSLITSDGTIKENAFTVSGDTRPVYATDKELYYLETDPKTNNTDIKKVTTANSTPSNVYKNLFTLKQGTVANDVVSLDGNNYYYVFNDNPDTRSVRKLTVSTNKKQTITDHFIGTLSLDSNGVIITALRNKYDELTSINTSGVINTIRIPSGHNQASQLPSAYHLGKNILLSTSDGISTVIGVSAPSDTTVARNESFDKKITATDQYSFDRNIEDSSDQSYSLTIVNGKYNDTVETAKKALTEKGISPYEIELSLSPGMRVEF